MLTFKIKMKKVLIDSVMPNNFHEMLGILGTLDWEFALGFPNSQILAEILMDKFLWLSCGANAVLLWDP